MIVRVEDAAHQRRRLDDLAPLVVAAIGRDVVRYAGGTKCVEIEVDLDQAAQQHCDAWPRDAMALMKLCQIPRERLGLDFPCLPRRRLAGSTGGAVEGGGDPMLDRRKPLELKGRQ